MIILKNYIYLLTRQSNGWDSGLEQYPCFKRGSPARAIPLAKAATQIKGIV
jgi:hypothetical protein